MDEDHFTQCKKSYKCRGCEERIHCSKHESHQYLCRDMTHCTYCDEMIPKNVYHFNHLVSTQTNQNVLKLNDFDLIELFKTQDITNIIAEYVDEICPNFQKCKYCYELYFFSEGNLHLQKCINYCFLCFKYVPNLQNHKDICPFQYIDISCQKCYKMDIFSHIEIHDSRKYLRYIKNTITDKLFKQTMRKDKDLIHNCDQHLTYFLYHVITKCEDYCSDKNYNH